MNQKSKPHYVDNKRFSQEVVNYCMSVEQAKSNNTVIPKVPDYIAMCFLKISEGLSHRPNFIRYTYREEMVMDAVENCLRAIENYNIEAATRTGSPNAFAYFTQIAWYAFLRRIEKENKQQDIKLRYLAQSGIEQYILSDTDDVAAYQVVQAFVDQLKGRIDKVKEADDDLKQFVKKEKIRGKRVTRVIVDSDLEDFME